MQRLVEILCDPRELKATFLAVRDDIETLATHQKGNYVLIALMSVYGNSQTSLELLEKILERLLPEIPKLITDPLGICVVNKMIETAQKEHHVH